MGKKKRAEPEKKKAKTSKEDKAPDYPYPQIMTFVCHHDPERSFFYKGKQFPVCARCTGLYGAMPIGFLTGILVTLVHDFGFYTVAALILLFLAPTVIDGLTQYFGWRTSTNPIRVTTGSLGGLAIGYGFGWLAVVSIRFWMLISGIQ